MPNPGTPKAGWHFDVWLFLDESKLRDCIGSGPCPLDK